MDYDVIILGGGSAGIVAGVTLGGFGLKVLLIEKAAMGGECLNTGCVPSKALIHCAKVAHTMRRAGEFGLPSVSLRRDDARGVMSHVRESVARVREADATETLLRDQGVEIRFGDARFTSPDALELDGETLRAEHFLLCTGSRPRVPDLPGAEHARVLTNQTVFDLEEVPPSLMVVGGGPVGVEMAQAFARLGSRVTLVQRGFRLLPRDDHELATALEGYLREDGVELVFNAEPVRFEPGLGGSTRVRLRRGDGEEIARECYHVLFAAGRLPNAEGLNLEAAGVSFTDEGVEVDGALHTTGPRVWACGDVLGKYQYSHMAEYEAKLVAQNIFLPVRQRTEFHVAPWCTFTDPELAHVGLTEEEAIEAKVPCIVLRQPFAQDDRALVEGEGKGTVKLLVSPGLRGEVLGASVLGPRAGELIGEFTLAMERGLGIRALADSVHVYPTLAMACQHAAQRWYEQKAKEPGVQAALKTYRTVRPALPAVGKGLAAGAALGGLWWLYRRFRPGRAEDSDGGQG
jgi:pyruvate/2-oxoglutarate dehydrogenase complex dihydrolipoamide dehydrogenase (E3) component